MHWPRSKTRPAGFLARRLPNILLSSQGIAQLGRSNAKVEPARLVRSLRRIECAANGLGELHERDRLTQHSGVAPQVPSKEEGTRITRHIQDPKIVPAEDGVSRKFAPSTPGITTSVIKRPISG